ncbi:hypothetical protein EJ110_NYTH08586 [Nymphaea thermarum]|nr:hypothetical protein EJ110_NYTH08586 [Nymphaea thermarum]
MKKKAIAINEVVAPHSTPHVVSIIALAALMTIPFAMLITSTPFGVKALNRTPAKQVKVFDAPRQSSSITDA